MQEYARSQRTNLNWVGMEPDKEGRDSRRSSDCETINHLLTKQYYPGSWLLAINKGAIAVTLINAPEQMVTYAG